MECACNLLYLSFNLGVKKNKQKECVMFYAYLASYIIIHYAGMLRLLCQDEYLLEKKWDWRGIIKSDIILKSSKQIYKLAY